MTRFEVIDRLAKRVLQGDVVFFVGAGFSLDSEGNSAGRLMARLVIRFLAMTDVIGANVLDRKIEVDQIRAGLDTTFDLSGALRRFLELELNREKPVRMAPEKRFKNAEDDLKKLNFRYYEVNDWFCGAFTRIVEMFYGRPELLPLVHQKEEKLRKALPGNFRDSVPFEPIPSILVDRDGTGSGLTSKDAGKVLFLEAMGFPQNGTMRGDPAKSTPLQKVERSYEGRLLPRHHVLARLAREGLCPVIITTNFDLLIEGAFRMAGFPGRPGEGLSIDRSHAHAPDARPEGEDFPSTLVEDFEVLASPVDFFRKGKAYRTATVVKMHGCARVYRQYRTFGNGTAELQEYLRSMVFTYREIQNWREDTWAAEFLRTLLRTRTVVFCGYSLQDPVIHDTFRTVYEEMAKQGGGRPKPVAPVETDGVSGAEAPAYFLGKSGESNEVQFHGMEVLRAATHAVGGSMEKFGDHENYIRFEFRNSGRFPNLDQLFRWLFHLTFRYRQLETIRSDLRRTSLLLLDTARPEAELNAVQEAMKKLVADEKRQSFKWGRRKGGHAAKVAEHSAITGWTEQFHAGLLREFACAEAVRRKRGPGLELGAIRRFGWYYPSMQDAGWTCWGAVVELALRTLAKAERVQIQPVECGQPTVLLYPVRKEASVPYAVTIHLAGFDPCGGGPRLFAHPVRRLFWQLRPEDALWPTTHAMATQQQNASRRTMAAPAAAWIWRLAAGDRLTPKLRKQIFT